MMLFLKFGKCWETKDRTIFWAMEGRKNSERVRFYLMIKPGLDLPKLHLTPEKPDEKPFPGQFTTIFRKHLGTGAEVLGFWEEAKEMWFHLRGPEGIYWMVYRGEPFFGLELYNESGDSLLRFTKKGIYTQRKAGALEKPELGSSHLEKLIPEPKGSREEKVKAEEEEPTHLEISEGQRDARHKLTRRIRTVKKALVKTVAGVPCKEDLDTMEAEVRLLNTYSYLVKPDDFELNLSAEQSGDKPRSIKLDPDKSLGKNIEERFDELKRKQKGRSLGEERLKAEKVHLFLLESLHQKLSTSVLSGIEVERCLAEAGILKKVQQNPQKPQQAAKGFRQFKDENSVIYRVGKSARENDDLTKSATANDYWCHIVAGSGSHVIVSFKSFKPELEALIKRRAAILALHFSPVREGREGEVYWTQRRHLRKKKGLALGLWLVEKSEHFFMRYEKEELAELLGKAVAV